MITMRIEKLSVTTIDYVIRFPYLLHCSNNPWVIKQEYFRE